MQRNIRPRESLLFTAGRLSSADAHACAVVQSAAYIKAYEAIDNATQGDITAFVRESGFIERKISYYKEVANSDLGARVARPLGSNVLTAVLGVCTVSQDSTDPTLVHVDGIFVDPDYSGNGIGSALLTSVLRDFPNWQTVRTETTDGTRAVSFFEKEGFVDTGVQASWPPQPYDWCRLPLRQLAMEATREQYFNAVCNH